MAQNMKDEDDELIDSFETFLKRQGLSEIVTPKICIKDYDYPGFYEVHASPIPGQPDAFLLLDIVSEVQGFNPGFLKIWKPFFVSHVSVSMFKDTFWWFFLHRFKANMEEDQNQLFDRIAGGFVSLLMTVQMNLKDKLFKVYADCLAQAVFTSFYKAFPASQEQFGDEFKTDVADLINFWVSGVKPKLLSWQSWKLAELCPADEGESVKDSACDRESAFEELVSKAQKLTSHFIGPGPQFQYVSFKQCGQSPLVLRYLQNFGIPTLAGSFTRKMRRTEISSLPYPGNTQHGGAGD
ncbi:protein FAM227B-like [Aplochiton taeniatus]